MCRLFGLHAGRRMVAATLWLLDSPDNLAAQSRRNPDGTGVGVFGAAGEPILRKQPMAAWQDREFACEAHELTGTTFLAHVRYATTGALDVANTHPFLRDGRLFAHNGVIEGLDALDDRLHALGATKLVGGQTDSERVFALITASIRRHDGDVAAGLTEAVGWVADNLPVFALNILLSTPTDMWALRYPDTHPLYLLDRRKSAVAKAARFDLRTHRIRARSRHLDTLPSVVFASEPMDDDPGWSLLDPGELVHVDEDLAVNRRLAFPDPPKHLLRRADLTGAVAAAQHDRAAPKAAPERPARYWPLGAGRVMTSAFGRRDGEWHSGTDFGRRGGSGNMPVYACQAGTVIHAGAAQGYGGPDPAGWLVIDSSDEQGSGCVEYGHIVREVANGQRVRAGQRIGHINPDSATNGRVAPHLHLSVMPHEYDPAAKMDPMPWLKGAMEPEDDPAVKLAVKRSAKR